MPRPSKLTPHAQETIVAALRVGATYEHAALVAGITYRTFRLWMQEGERTTHGRFFHFFQAVKRAEAEAAVKWLARIEQAADDGVWQAAAWKLERRYPEQWGRRDKVDVKHEGTVDVHVLASLRTAILSAVGDDMAMRVRISEALAALDEPKEAAEGDDDERSA